MCKIVDWHSYDLARLLLKFTHANRCGVVVFIFHKFGIFKESPMLMNRIHKLCDILKSLTVFAFVPQQQRINSEQKVRNKNKNNNNTKIVRIMYQMNARFTTDIYFMHESVRAPKLLCKLIAFRFRMRCVYSSVVFFFIRPFFFLLIHYMLPQMCVTFIWLFPCFGIFGDTICVRAHMKIKQTNK